MRHSWRRRHWLHLLLAVAASLGGAGCTDLSLEPEVPLIHTIRVNVDEIRFSSLRDTVILNAQALDADGREVSGAVITFSIDSGDVVIIDGNRVISQANGITRVLARAVDSNSAPVGNGYDQSGAVAWVDVEVAQTVDRLAFSTAVDTLQFWAIGERLRISATPVDGRGNAVPGVEPVTWQSSDSSLVRIQDDGWVTAMGHGSGRITASHGHVQASIGVRADVAFSFGGCVTSSASRFREEIGQAGPNGQACTVENFEVHLPLDAEGHG